jgi:hypothetical protein
MSVLSHKHVFITLTSPLVLDETAVRALEQLGRVLRRIHGDVGRITSDNLMKIGSVFHARLDEGICSLNDKLRARKSQHVGLSSDIVWGCRSSEDSGPLHLEQQSSP